MGKMSKMVKQCSERFCQKQIWLHELRQPCCADVVDYIHQRDIYYWPAEFNVSSVVMSQTTITVAAPSPTTLEELMLTLGIIFRQLQIMQAKTWQWCSLMRLDSDEPQSHKHIASFPQVQYQICPRLWNQTPLIMRVDTPANSNCCILP